MEVLGKEIPFLVDTGATISCIRQNDLKCPLSNTTVKTVGISGKVISDKLSQPLPIDLEDLQLFHSFIVSPTVPVSLIGRDLLSKLNATIYCSPDGLEINIPSSKVHQLFANSSYGEYKAKTILKDEDFIDNLFLTTTIKKLAACQATLATKMLNMKPTQPPFSTETITEEQLKEVPHCFYASPHGMLLLWKTTSDKISSFVIAVRTDFNDVELLLNSFYQHLDMTPDNTDQGKDFIVWSYGKDPTCFFIKDLHNHVKPAIHTDQEMKITLKPPSVLSTVPSELWAKHANHVGLLKMPPYKARINYNKYPVYVRQYPLSKEKEEGIQPVIKSLEEQGVIAKRQSPNNTPINPILKPGTNKYRFTQDLRKVNEAVYPIAPIVPDTNSILAALPADSKWYTVVDLSSAYFSIPLEYETQSLFGFTFKNEQYVWCRLPMGFIDSAAVYSAAVNMHLSQLVLPGPSTLLTYCDDLLVASPTEADCIQDSLALLTHLAKGGHRASLTKLQFCQQAVNYLGYVLKDGCRYLSPERVKAIMDITRPRTKTEMLSFLGLVNYCRAWLAEYAAFDSQLRQATIKDAPETVQWTDEMKQAFRHIKYLLCTAPALGLPDYKLPFHLYVTEDGTAASAVLAQMHGERPRPVAYYSKILPLIVQGMVPCLRAVAAAAIMVEKSQIIVLGHPMTLHTSHTVNIILLNITTQHMTSQRRSNYEHILTGTPNLTISTTTHKNPALHLKILLHGEEKDYENFTHDCMELINSSSSVRMDLQQTPLDNNDLILYCDGSSMRPDDKTILSGYAVVDNQNNCLEAFKLPVSSAQAAEVIALTRSCILAEDKRTTIYTDSKYAFSAAHDFSKIWENRGFITTSGKPIQYADLIKDLLTAIMLPSQIAIVKCAGHSKLDSEVAKGNSLADKYAKDAALHGSLPPWMNDALVMVMSTDPPFTVENMLNFQKQAKPSEITLWEKKGCRKDDKGLWKFKDGRIALPRLAYDPVISYTHGVTHVNYKAVTKYISKLFFTIGLEQQVRDFIRRCLICARCNPQVNPVKHDHLPKPDGPFQQLQIDFTHMPKVRGFSYLLVCVDRFSKWTEAFPTRKENAQTVVKCLMEHIIPRFGIPVGIDSDNGTPFTSRVTRLLAKALGIEWSFHIPYHPQSSGQVERTNRTIKDKLLKIHQSKQMNWLDALPLALLSMRAMPNQTTGLSPHEVLMGRPFPLGVLIKEQVPMDLTQLQEMQQNYVQHLFSFVSKYSKQVIDFLPSPSEESMHTFQPGDYVLVRSLKTTPGEPRYGPPTQVLLVTRTAVKVKGQPQWIHASRIKMAPSRIDENTP